MYYIYIRYAIAIAAVSVVGDFMRRIPSSTQTLGIETSKVRVFINEFALLPIIFIVLWWNRRSDVQQVNDGREKRRKKCNYLFFWAYFEACVCVFYIYMHA